MFLFTIVNTTSKNSFLPASSLQMNSFSCLSCFLINIQCLNKIMALFTSELQHKVSSI